MKIEFRSCLSAFGRFHESPNIKLQTKLFVRISRTFLAIGSFRIRLYLSISWHDSHAISIAIVNLCTWICNEHGKSILSSNMDKFSLRCTWANAIQTWWMFNVFSFYPLFANRFVYTHNERKMWNTSIKNSKRYYTMIHIWYNSRGHGSHEREIAATHVHCDRE